MDASGEAHDTRARRLLALGAAAGLLLAALSLLRAPGRDALPADAVARVGDAVISGDDYARLLAALASDRRAPLSEEDRRHVLDRMIEEELLVQHAVDLGLLHSDRRARAELVSAVLGSLNAAADAYEPTDAEVEAFFAEHGGYFARPARLWVRDVFVRGTDGEALERAREAARRLRDGEDLQAVRAELADEPVAPLPDAPLPPAKLREYLGPSALEAALALEPGAVGDPVATPQGHHVLLLVERSDASAPPLAEVEAQVRAEMRRRHGDRLLRERLDALRARADVRVADELREEP